MHSRHRFPASVLLLAALVAPSSAHTQTSAPIQDNSFLVEEAYNHQRHVVQTIQTFQRVAGSSGWAYALTQEWPAPHLRHQISVTLPMQSVPSASGPARGIGDAALNYRYQLLGDGTATVALSPRVTLLIPTGNADRALGTGGFGLQVNLPLSVALSPSFVTHTNLGATHVLSARARDGTRAPLTSWNAGQSVVWLARENFNALIEAVVARNASFADGGGTEQVTEAWVSPGIRFALNLPGHLQIVPGVAVPIGIGPARGKTGIFLYLSVELPLLGRGDR